MEIYKHKETGILYFSSLMFCGLVLYLSSKTKSGELDTLFADYTLNLDDDAERIKNEFELLSENDVIFVAKDLVTSETKELIFKDATKWHKTRNRVEVTLKEK